MWYRIRGCSERAQQTSRPTALLDPLRARLMDLPSSARDNALLAALPEAAYCRPLPDLEATTLRVGDVLFRQTGRPSFAYFPTRSTVSLLYAADTAGEMATAWPVGREGMVGISLFLGVQKLDNQADVQIGGTAFRLPAPACWRSSDGRVHCNICCCATCLR